MDIQTIKERIAALQEGRDKMLNNAQILTREATKNDGAIAELSELVKKLESETKDASPEKMPEQQA